MLVIFRVAYYSGGPKRDPNLDNYPYRSLKPSYNCFLGSIRVNTFKTALFRNPKALTQETDLNYVYELHTV